MIIKYYEFGCDYCGQGFHPEPRSKASAIRSYRKEGGVLTKEGLCFCGTDCHKAYKQSLRQNKGDKHV